MDEIAQQAENIAFDVTMAHNHEAAISVVASSLRYERRMAAATIDSLVAALESCVEEINDLAEEIAQNGGVEFDRGAQWPDGSAIHQAQAALALARANK